MTATVQVKPFLQSQQLKIILGSLEKLFDEHKIDDTHGFTHACKVMDNTSKALASYLDQIQVTLREQLKGDTQHSNIRDNEGVSIDVSYYKNVLLAGLLHDADDRKYFPYNKAYENAQKIARQYFQMIEEEPDKIQQQINQIKNMISKVSFSTNGDKVDYGQPEIFLYPRYADRIEAIGIQGIIRSYEYNLAKGAPLYTQHTKVPLTFQEVISVSEGRDKKYIQSGGKSDSFIDHIFDKIIHLELPEFITNRYLRLSYENSRKQIANFVIQCAKNRYKNIQEIINTEMKRINQTNSEE